MAAKPDLPPPIFPQSAKGYKRQQCSLHPWGSPGHENCPKAATFSSPSPAGAAPASLKFAAENQSLLRASRQPHTPAVLGSSPALQKPRAKKCTRDGLLVRVWRSVTKG